MKFEIVDYKKFLENKDFYYEQIPKAQNSDEKYKPFIFTYYKEALKSNDKSFISICKEDNEIVGIALIRYYIEEKKFFLINVNTRKDFQHSNKKIGTNVVLNGLKNFFENKVDNEIFLWVNKDNIYAKKIYEKVGFEKTSYYPTKLKFLENSKGEEIYCLSKEKYMQNNNKKNEFI